MLRLIIEGDELWDEEKETFSNTEDQVIELEHSLISISKWESIYQKPFLASDEKTSEELFGYIRAMVLSPNVDPDFLNRLASKHLQAIQGYIDSNQSATTFGFLPDRRGPGEIITSELIYYWLVAFNIPFECQYWHLNRLFSLIRICNIKNSKPRKMSKEEVSRRYRDLNAERKAKYGTKG